MDPKHTHFASLSLFIFLLPIVHATSHFVLVHGACHGAWSWYKIVPPLMSHGHNVSTIDLAASGIDPEQPGSLRSISGYFRPLMEFMASLPPHKKVILVGHSLGGLAISQAMERFSDKISVAVFVNALMPGPRLNISALNRKSLRGDNRLMDSRYEYGDGSDKPPTTLALGPNYLKFVMYPLSPIEDWVLATTLVRPVRLFSRKDQSKNIVLTKEKYGSIKRVYIISEKDEVEKKDFQLWMIRRNPPDEVLEIFGSDHMVIMSKPTQLCTLLFNIAAKYN